ncbi:MAG: hypothetical protein ACQETH_16965 [Candidatus Rifleibacteriota bacterium]
MVKINSSVIILLIANLALFIASGTISFDGNIEEINQKINELKKQLPELKEKYEWAEKAENCLIDPPGTDSGKLLAKWTRMASRLGLQMDEASQNSGKISGIELSGSGSFNRITMVLNNIAAEKAALAERIRLVSLSGQSWEFSAEISVRNGPWKYSAHSSDKLPVPAKISNNFSPIRSGKPFAQTMTMPKRQNSRKERIRYIGFFKDNATPTVIIETSGRFLVLECGEKTPNGSLIEKADVEAMNLSHKDNSGQIERWTVKMEKK